MDTNDASTEPPRRDRRLPPESVAHDLTQSRTLVGELEAALEAHARLEDELLFCHLESLLPQQGPLAVMRAEHQEIEGLLASLADSSDASDAYSRIQRLVVVARDHFAKEEQVLFPLAEQILEESQIR
jgi:hemerythrin-like domain-containing protein